jgi:hypothetical protein
MRACKRNFPGVDSQTSDRLALDVGVDERAILDSIVELRKEEAASLEAIAYMLGNSPGRLSQYLKGTCTTSLTNYLRIVRALGYRCKIVFEKADVNSTSPNPLSEMRLPAHKVFNHR